MRHTYTTRYLRRANDLAGLQQLLGHAEADIRTTMRKVTSPKTHSTHAPERAFGHQPIIVEA